MMHQPAMLQNPSPFAIAVAAVVAVVVVGPGLVAEVSVSTVVNTAGGPKVRICRFQDCEETWVQSSICFMTVITTTDSHADDSFYKS